jgi:hypothetical protein
MRYRKSTACAGFALLALGVSLAAPQSERKRQFDYRGSGAGDVEACLRPSPAAQQSHWRGSRA